MRRSAWLAISVTVIWTTSFAQDGPPPQAPQAGGDPAARAAARDKFNAAQAAEWNKKPAPSDPRDFSGVWWTRGYDRTFRPVADHPMSPGEAASLLPMTPLEAASITWIWKRPARPSPMRQPNAFPMAFRDSWPRPTRSNSCMHRA